jgi:hypothetical protein
MRRVVTVRCKQTLTIHSTRHRAKKLGIPFTLTVDWLKNNTPEICPVLEIPLVRGIENGLDSSPSIDRLIPELGYTQENCRVISHRANTIKSSASPKELRKVAKWLEKELLLAAS